MSRSPASAAASVSAAVRPVVAPQATGWRRLSVNVAYDVADAIDELRQRRGWSITEVIRRAVSILKFVNDEEAKGGRILVERDGAIREVQFL